MKDSNPENNSHEEEIPVFRPGALGDAAPSEEPAAMPGAEEPEPAAPGLDELDFLGVVDLEPGSADQDVKADSAAAAGDYGKISELRDANLRMRADFENFRRRAAKQRLEIADQARVDVIRHMLPVLDNLERALGAAEEQAADSGWIEGLRMVRVQFLAALREQGILPMECLGKEFDPELHEVVATVPNEAVPSGFITAEVNCGYQKGEIVVRAAQVVTSAGAPDANGDTDASE